MPGNHGRLRLSGKPDHKTNTAKAEMNSWAVGPGNCYG